MSKEKIFSSFRGTDCAMYIGRLGRSCSPEDRLGAHPRQGCRTKDEGQSGSVAEPDACGRSGSSLRHLRTVQPKGA